MHATPDISPRPLPKGNSLRTGADLIMAAKNPTSLTLRQRQAAIQRHYPKLLAADAAKQYADDYLNKNSKNEIPDCTLLPALCRSEARKITVVPEHIIFWDELILLVPAELRELYKLVTDECPLICVNPPINRDPVKQGYYNVQYSLHLNGQLPVEFDLYLFTMPQYGDKLRFVADGCQRGTAIWRENVRMELPTKTYFDLSLEEARAVFLVANSGKGVSPTSKIKSGRGVTKVSLQVEQDITSNLMFYYDSKHRDRQVLAEHRVIRGGPLPWNRLVEPIKISDALRSWAYPNMRGNTFSAMCQSKNSLRNVCSGLSLESLVDTDEGTAALEWALTVYICLLVCFHTEIHTDKTNGALPDIKPGLKPAQLGRILAKSDEQMRSRWLFQMIKNQSAAHRMPAYMRHWRFLIYLAYLSRLLGIDAVLSSLPALSAACVQVKPPDELDLYTTGRIRVRGQEITMEASMEETLDLILKRLNYRRTGPKLSGPITAQMFPHEHVFEV